MVFMPPRLNCSIETTLWSVYWCISFTMSSVSLLVTDSTHDACVSQVK